MKRGTSLVLFDDADHPLAAPLAAWETASPRFAAFVEEHRDKIRKKARGARDAEALDDLLLELAVARDLHGERHGAIVYEPRLPDRTRAPDFAVTLRSGAIVMVEVTRMRPAVAVAAEAGVVEASGHAVAWTPIDGRLAAAICGKFGQLVPNLPNVLVVGVPAALLATLDVARDACADRAGRAARVDPDRALRSAHAERLLQVLSPPQRRAGASMADIVSRGCRRYRNALEEYAGCEGGPGAALRPLCGLNEGCRAGCTVQRNVRMRTYLAHRSTRRQS